MKHTAIYPFTHDDYPLVEYSEFLNHSIQIDALVSPKGYGLHGKQVQSRNGEKSWEVLSSLTMLPEKVNSLIIPRFNGPDSFKKKVVDQVIAFLPHLSTVFYYSDLGEELHKKLRVMCETSGVEFIQSYACNIIEHDYDKELKEYDVPILCIAGVWESTDKFYVALAVHEQLVEKGYRVSHIGSRSYSELLGFHTFPSFMFDSRDAVDKIYMLNEFVFDICAKERPDILLITVPGSTYELNRCYSNGFGVLPYIVFKALTVDFLIMCTLFEPSENGISFMELLNKVNCFRYNTEIDCYHMSDKYIDFAATREKHKVIVNHVGYDLVDQALDEYYVSNSIPIVNLHHRSTCEEVVELVISKLS